MAPTSAYSITQATNANKHPGHKKTRRTKAEVKRDRKRLRQEKEAAVQRRVRRRKAPTRDRKDFHAIQGNSDIGEANDQGSTLYEDRGEDQ